jgi:tricorn protease
VEVHEGDYILAINGHAVDGGSDIHALLLGLEGAEVRLSVASSLSGLARDVTVRPLADERGLRYADWVRANRQRVTAASGGRVGYVHLAAVEKNDVDKFRRECRALRGKVDALIIDERNNSGGGQPLDVIDSLERPPARMAFDRRGEIPPFISPFLDVPKVMVANELSVSGGDELAFYFRQRKIGPLVGVRTMGGMIGNGAQHKIEGGWTMAVPEIAFFVPETGAWHAENLGVEPDYRIEWKPADYAASRDPQLEKAVELALAAIPGYRKRIPAVTPYRTTR